MNFVIVNVGIQNDENRESRERAILDVIELDLLSEVNNEGSSDETYNMNFDLQITGELQFIMEQVTAIADFVELEEFPV
jgi:hypothetical protein